jgi:hypothetical protein
MRYIAHVPRKNWGRFAVDNHRNPVRFGARRMNRLSELVGSGLRSSPAATRADGPLGAEAIFANIVAVSLLMLSATFRVARIEVTMMIG